MWEKDQHSNRQGFVIDYPKYRLAGLEISISHISERNKFSFRNFQQIPYQIQLFESFFRFK